MTYDKVFWTTIEKFSWFWGLSSYNTITEMTDINFKIKRLVKLKLNYMWSNFESFTETLNFNPRNYWLATYNPSVYVLIQVPTMVPLGKIWNMFFFFLFKNLHISTQCNQVFEHVQITDSLATRIGVIIIELAGVTILILFFELLRFYVRWVSTCKFTVD